MIAKYPGTCAACGEPIERGDKIDFYRKGHAEHNACRENSIQVCEDADANLEPGTLANDRRLARNGLSVIRFSNGDVMTQNSRGRCEDAPCCGCCS